MKMNKLIVGMAIVLGVIVGMGFGQERDPRLITKKGEVWETFRISSVDANYRLNFFEDGTLLVAKSGEDMSAWLAIVYLRGVRRKIVI